MRYFDALRFVWRGPKGWTNLLLGAACVLVPVVGPIVFIGYLFEVIDSLHSRQTDATYPEFEVNRLGKYFAHGVWPFVTSLLLGLVSWLVFFALGLTAAVIVTLMTDGFTAEPDPVLLAALVASTLLLAWLFGVVYQVFTTPIYLRSGLMQEFGPAFSWRFVVGFVTRVGAAELKVAIAFSVIIAAVMAVGTACFGLPLFFVWPWLLFAQHHFLYQLYELYLRRGGEPIPLPPPEVDAAPMDYAEEDDGESVPEALPG